MEAWILFGPRAPNNGESFLDFIHRYTVSSPAFEVSPSNSQHLDHRRLQRKATSPRCFLSGPGSCISHAGSYQSSELRHRTKVPSFLRKSGPPTETAWECLEMHSPNTITLEFCQPRDTLSVPATFWRGRGTRPPEIPPAPYRSHRKRLSQEWPRPARNAGLETLHVLFTAPWSLRGKNTQRGRVSFALFQSHLRSPLHPPSMGRCSRPRKTWAHR